MCIRDRVCSHRWAQSLTFERSALCADGAVRAKAHGQSLGKSGVVVVSPKGRPRSKHDPDRLYLAWSVESLHSLLAYSCTKTQVNTGVSARSAYVRTNFPCLKETFCTASPFRSIDHLVPHLGCSAHRPVHAVSVSCYTALCTGTGCAGRNPYRYRLCGYTGSW